MASLKMEQQENISILRLENGITNALSPLLLDELSLAINDAEKASQGMVVAGNTKFFSMGFDLPVLIKLERTQMSDFFHHFNQIILNLYTISIPTVCCIAGHAVAGGMILALTCDYRFAEEGSKKVGLNEIKLGLPVPYLADLILRQLVGDRAATELMYQGNFIPVTETRQWGLVDRVFPKEVVESAAIKQVSEMAALSRPAFTAIKRNRTDNIRRRYDTYFKQKNETFLDCWFSDIVQKRLIEAAGKFSR